MILPLLIDSAIQGEWDRRDTKLTVLMMGVTVGVFGIAYLRDGGI